MVGITKAIIGMAATLLSANWINIDSRPSVAGLEDRQQHVVQPFCECSAAMRCHRRKRHDIPVADCENEARAQCEHEFREAEPDRVRNIMRSRIRRFELLVHVAPITKCAPAKKLLRAHGK